MAAKDKAQDEKNLKILRELAALSSNKYCFDCQQRGPTYVNVTIGSFVCTSCSGILRGLNPPHRIKSITMTSFTAEEMDQIKSKGNEYCKSVWLGKYNSDLSNEVEYQNIHKLKEFLIQKYEDKKYYVEPEIAARKSKPRAPSIPNSTVSQSRSQTSIETKPATHLLQKTGWMSQDFPSGMTTSSDKEFAHDPFKQSALQRGASVEGSFADFSSAFGSDEKDSSSVSSPPTSNASSNFANFDSNAATSCASNTPQTNANLAKSIQKKPAPPPPDRYAALADLDNQLHQQLQVIPPAASPGVMMATNAAPMIWSGAGVPTYCPVIFDPTMPNRYGQPMPAWAQQPVAVNPFQGLPPGHLSATAQGQMPMSIHCVPNGIPNGGGDHAAMHHPNGSLATSLWTHTAMGTPWGAQFQGKPMEGVTSQTTLPHPDSYNPWAQCMPSEGVNPFSNGGPAQNQVSSKTNPFL